MIKRFTALLSFVCFFSVLSAQTSDNLKDFIAKNNIAIRSVQKNIIAQNVTSFDVEFKELLKEQVAAVKSYNSNKEYSSLLAHSVRVKCLNFLKKYTTGSLEYYAISADENKQVSSKTEITTSVLTADELKKINEMDIKNIQTLNTLPLTIQ